jgi:hypothetical protein
MKKITVLTQSYHQPELLEILVRSFEKYKIDDVEISYLIIEGSSNTSYANHIKSLSKNIVWFNNDAADEKNPIIGASTANGKNIEFGKKMIQTDWTFVCHNDVAVTSKKFFETFLKLSENYELISTCKDNARICACHISGLFVKTELLQKVDCMPALPELDVGDRLTQYCRAEGLNYISLPNSHNDESILRSISGLWNELGTNCGVDRCIVDGEVIFTHLGRGTPKSLNAYSKAGKITHQGWIKLHQDELKK